MKKLNKMSIRWRLTLVMALVLTAVNLIFALISVLAAKDIYRLSNDENIKIDYSKPQIGHPGLMIKEQQDDEFASRNLIYAILTILTGSAATYFLSGIALRPVLTLSKEVNNIDENKLHLRVKTPQSNDEVAALANCFNNLFERLEKAFTAQKNFSANAAHELRTPLAGIISSIEVLQMDEVPDSNECMETMKDVLHNAERLSNLVEDLLKMNRELSLSECGFYGLQEMISEIKDGLSAELTKKQIEFKSHCGSIKVYGEKNLLHRVLFNLIHNAIKYNKQDGEITVSAKAESGNTVITITDTGIGIPEAEKERIFEPFYCIDKSRARELGGSGLGLSIVKLIIEKHNGTIEVESRLQAYTAFTVCFPDVPNQAE